MDQLGPMFLYLLPLPSPFLVQSWNTTQWNSKKMGKNVLQIKRMFSCTPSLLCMLIFILYALIAFSAPFPACSLLLPSFIVCAIYIFLADKYNIAHTKHLKSLAFKCLRLSAIMIMQPPFIILLVSLKANTHSSVN